MKTTSPRTAALIRDIAQLFVSYPSETWEPVLEQLMLGGASQTEIADAIRALIDHAAAAKRGANKAHTRPKAKAKKRSKGKIKASATTVAEAAPVSAFSAERHEVLNAIGQAIAQRQLLPTPADMREMFLKSGGKGELPKVRKSAILVLLRHLDGVSKAVLDSTLASLKENAAPAGTEEAYARWFKLIRPSP